MAGPAPPAAALVALACLGAAPPVRAACDDDALSAAAAELALGGDATDGVDGRDVARALAAARSSDLRVRVAVLEPDDEAALAAFLERARARTDAPLVCGEAWTGAHRVVLATGRGGSLERHGAGFLVALAPGFDRPELVLEGVSGEVRRVPVEPGAVSLEPGADPEAVVVQLLARGPDGVRPVARLGRPDAPPVAVTDGTTPAALLTALRDAADVAPVRPNRLLARVAGEHAERACRVGRAAHAPDGGADPEARLRRAGLVARHVGEAVALGPDLAAALAALADSPAHRATLVDPRMTDAGLGTARAGGRRCVVVILAAWPRASGG